MKSIKRLLITIIAPSSILGCAFAISRIHAETSLTNDAILNIKALGQDNMLDCSYIRTEIHCVFNRKETTEIIKNEKKIKKESTKEVPYFNIAVVCKPGGNASCKPVSCKDVFKYMKQIDPNITYKEQPKNQKYFNRFLK